MTPISNLLTFVGLGITLLLVWRQSWPARLTLFVAQSLVLALLAAAIGVMTGRAGLLVVAVGFVALKGWLIPRALRRIAGGTPIRGGVAPGRSAGLSLLAAGGLVVLAYVILLPILDAAARPGGASALPASAQALPTAGAIPLAFAMALIGLYVCVTGRDVLGHILGFLMLENGIFGLALLATYGLPGLVEAGVFLDVLAIVLIMEGVVVQIRRTHESIDVSRLRELRG